MPGWGGMPGCIPGTIPGTMPGAIPGAIPIPGGAVIINWASPVKQRRSQDNSSMFLKPSIYDQVSSKLRNTSYVVYEQMHNLIVKFPDKVAQHSMEYIPGKRNHFNEKLVVFFL